jgi:putrescine aminotransferase
MTSSPVLAHLQDIDRKHLLHPFTDHTAMRNEGSAFIQRADGVYIWDVDGKKFLDGMSGLWCVNVGYGRSELVEAAAQQMSELPFYNSFFSCTTSPTALLAQLLSEITPTGLSQVFFTNSGSEATDTALRLVLSYWQATGQPERRIFIGRQNGYHGSTIAAVGLGGMTYMHAQGSMAFPEIEHVQQPYHFGEGREMTPDAFGLQAARSLERKIEEIGAHRIAAFYAEPLQGAGGVIVPPSTYWPEIKRICAKHDILLVADEVICGFGRMGTWFGSDYYELTPDVLTMAKGISSGYLPIGAVMLSDKIADTLARHPGLLAHGFTYSGHPTACAVAARNIQIIRDEGLVERVASDIGPYFQASWATLADHPLVGEARGIGLLAAIELVQSKVDMTRFDPSLMPGKCLRQCATANGLVVRPIGANIVVSAPPLTITRDQVDELVTKLRKSLDDTARRLNPMFA